MTYDEVLERAKSYENHHLIIEVDRDGDVFYYTLNDDYGHLEERMVIYDDDVFVGIELSGFEGSTYYYIESLEEYEDWKIFRKLG